MLSSIDYDDYEDEEDFCSVLAARIYRRYPDSKSAQSCYYCGDKSHRWMDCFKLKAKLQQGGMRRSAFPNRSSSRGRPVRRPSNNPSRSNTFRRSGQSKPSTTPRRRFGRGHGRQNNFRRTLFNMLDACLESGEEDEDGEEDGPEGEDVEDNTGNE